MKTTISAFCLIFCAFVCLPAQSIPIKLFPDNNIWNTPIDNAPLHANSATYVSTIGASIGLHPDFGSGLYNGSPMGIPYVLVGAGQKMRAISFDYADESDAGPYPIPDNPPIEGGISSSGDRHVLVVDTTNAILYEIYSSYQQPDSSWHGGSGAVFNLNSNQLRPDTWTSADAAGLPILPGLVRYDEILKGEINHAIRFTVPKTQRAYLWPARHYASAITDKAYPPMGLRMRLKADFNISSYSPACQIILKALKKYGMILADNGSAWFISGVPDDRWNNDQLNELKQVKGTNFEAVDESGLMIAANSGEAKQSANKVVEFKENSHFDIIKANNGAFEFHVNAENHKKATIEIYNINGALINSINV